jgi:hypothetical protein
VYYIHYSKTPIILVVVACIIFKIETLAASQSHRQVYYLSNTRIVLNGIRFRLCQFTHTLKQVPSISSESSVSYSSNLAIMSTHCIFIEKTCDGVSTV